MARHVATATVAATATTPPLHKGDVVELTAAQEAALAASLRTTTRRDASGESVGVSN